MENLVRVVSQSEMVQRNWTNNQGETRVIKTVEVTLTDGIDTFVAEANDTLAESINAYPLETDALYTVRCKLMTREWETKEHKKAKSTTIKLLNIQKI